MRSAIQQEQMPRAIHAPPRPREEDTLPGRKDTLLRRLALAKLRELRRSGMSYREIAERFGLGPGQDKPGESFHFRLPPERLLRSTNPDAEADPIATPDGALFLRALDALEPGLAFFSPEGTLLHANRAFARALECGFAGACLRAEVENFARAMGSLVALRSLGEDEVVEQLATREVPAEEATLRLRGSYVGLDLFGTGGTLLIALEQPPPEPLSDEALAARFGLSKKESRIARLLVEGRSSAEIAQRLFISRHTARHHIERILRKLGAHSRAEAVGRLLRGNGE